MSLSSVDNTKPTKTVEGELFYKEESLSHVMSIQAYIFKNGVFKFLVETSEVEGKKFKFNIQEKYFDSNLILKITHTTGVILYFNLKPGVMKRDPSDPLFEISKYKTGYSFHLLKTNELEKMQQVEMLKAAENLEQAKENLKNSLKKLSQETQAPNSHVHSTTLIRRSQSVGSY